MEFREKIKSLLEITSVIIASASFKRIISRWVVPTLDRWVDRLPNRRYEGIQVGLVIICMMVLLCAILFLGLSVVW